MFILNIFDSYFLIRVFLMPAILGFFYLVVYKLKARNLDKYFPKMFFIIYTLFLGLWLSLSRYILFFFDPGLLNNEAIFKPDYVLLIAIIFYSVIMWTYEKVVWSVAIIFLSYEVYFLTTFENILLLKDMVDILISLLLIALLFYLRRNRENVKYSLFKYSVIALLIILLWLLLIFLLEDKKLTVGLIQIYAITIIKFMVTIYIVRGGNYLLLEPIESYSLLREENEIDNLTKAYNRKKLIHVLEELQIYRKNNLLNLSIAMFDVDFFKNINDNYGHSLGDRVLIDIVEISKDVLNSNKGDGQVFRFGGDEFIVLFRGKDEKEALWYMEEILHEIRKKKYKNGNSEFNITISCGVKTISPKDTINEVLENADFKLYEAKAKGRNQVA
ncbi:GGDEF domain-containing protein [Lactococcus lactis]|uniref:GGDEF domain-containing protein n=1 Tax=Lactococcus lactis TaxID=1358 RepID=UPI0033956D31